jgi:hypothetical protein
VNTAIHIISFINIYGFINSTLSRALFKQTINLSYMPTGIILNNEEWKRSGTNVFWGEIAPTDHLVQIYENDDVVMKSLEGFADSGLKAGESVIIIATEKRLALLNGRLKSLGYELELLQSTFQYIPLNVHETLAQFMKAGWPDELLFMQLIQGLVLIGHG